MLGRLARSVHPAFKRPERTKGLRAGLLCAQASALVYVAIQVTGHPMRTVDIQRLEPDGREAPHARTIGGAQTSRSDGISTL